MTFRPYSGYILTQATDLNDFCVLAPPRAGLALTDVTNDKMKKCSTLISKQILPAFLLAGGLMLFVGCGQRAARLTAEQSRAFDSAPAETKQTWEKALAADKANDYVNAQNCLDSLGQMTLSDPQRQALETENTAFGARLMAAVDKNDPAAVKAVQEINKSRTRRK